MDKSEKLPEKEIPTTSENATEDAQVCFLLNELQIIILLNIRLSLERRR